MNATEKLRTSTRERPLKTTGEVIPFSQSKIAAAHREKLAIVYVRQSSPQQVQENRESTARQYALADYAERLGWASDRVLVIDEDQGQSGASAVHRSGFQRLLAEVTMDHVGLVLGLEMSRLARSSKDWHHLLEVCAIFGTLLADQDGIYEPGDPNDRMLLGLKGTMSEVELHTMRNRLDRGRVNKAQRGELFFSVPMGYVLLPNGKADLDPDEHVRSVVCLLFEKYEELGSVRGLFVWLAGNGITLPFRSRSGSNAGQLDWRRPSLPTLYQVLRHPIYAGAYSYGRRPHDPKRRYGSEKRKLRKWLPPEQWQVLIRDQLPAYITWDCYLRNGERLKQNQSRPDTLGPPRDGCALLCGLLVCGHCDRRMVVRYRIKDKPFYDCQQHLIHARERTCFGLSGNVLDELVIRQVLRAVEPASLELSRKARADLDRENGRMEKHWKQKLQRAHYEAELAERRYRAVDPENRLVAGTLERQWEEAMCKERELKEAGDRYKRQSVAQLSIEDESRLESLASDIPALWRSPQTTNADRQAIIRCLVERIVVQVERNSEHAECTIHWCGGYESRHSLVRPVRTYEQLRDGDLLLKRVEELRNAGKTASQIADGLNAEGFLPINPHDRFKRESVYDLLFKLGRRGEQNDDTLLKSSEWWIRDLATKIKVSWQTLREWAVNGWVHGRQTQIQKLWIIWADDDELRRLKKLQSASPRGILGYPTELTTAKSPPD